MNRTLNSKTIFKLFKHDLPYAFILIGLVCSMCIFWKHEYILFSILGYSIFQLWYLNMYRLYEIIIAVILGLGFMIGEVIVVKTGVWRYSNISCICIPIWLYFAWCHTVICISRISTSLSFIMMTLDKRI